MTRSSGNLVWHHATVTRARREQLNTHSADRARVRSLVPHGDFIAIYCDCPLEVCEERDVKGIYKRARAGEISDFTGISAPYEVPADPELVVATGALNLDESATKVIGFLQGRGIIAGLTNGK